LYSRICFLADQDLGDGFGLGGVEVLTTNHIEEAFKTIRKLLQTKEFGLIAVPEDWLAGIEKEFQREWQGREWPLLIPYPSAKGPAAKDHIAEMVKQAIGYYVKLR